MATKEKKSTKVSKPKKVAAKPKKKAKKMTGSY